MEAQKKKVLIIDDETLISRMYERAFRFEGFDVVTAGSGKIGLEKAKETKPDVILLDIMMPQMSGLVVLDILKTDAELKSIPVLIITNSTETEDARQAVAKGAKDYLIKSQFKPREVVNKVREALGMATVVIRETLQEETDTSSF